MRGAGGRFRAQALVSAPLIVLLGAAVRPDGTASPALARRIGYAAAAAKARPEALVFCSGAKGRHGPSEASVMAAALGPALGSERLVLDEESCDTLQSVIAAARFMRARGLGCCIVCTDSYHLLRTILLFRALGLRASAGPVERGRGSLKLSTWLRMRARDAVATPYDLALMILRRRKILERTRP